MAPKKTQTGVGPIPIVSKSPYDGKKFQNIAPKPTSSRTNSKKNLIGMGTKSNDLGSRPSKLSKKNLIGVAPVKGRANGKPSNKMTMEYRNPSMIKPYKKSSKKK